MAFRCDIHLNGGQRKLILAPRPEETVEHIALKLSAFVLFWAEEPIVDPSLKHPALLGQEFRPDLIALNPSGEVKLWIECGQASLHKLDKLTRRYPYARLVVVKSNIEDAQKTRADVTEKLTRGHVEIWGWREEDFKLWKGALGDSTEIFGEAQGRSLNLTINHVPLAADLVEV